MPIIIKISIFSFFYYIMEIIITNIITMEDCFMTTNKCSISNSYTVGNGHRVKRTAIEGLVTDGSHSIGNIHGGQTNTSFESTPSN